MPQGHAQSGDGERSIEDRTHGPAEDAPTADIQDRDQIEPILAGQDAGGIGDPDLIRPLDGEARETVGRDRSVVAAVGRPLSVKSGQPHRPRLQLRRGWMV